MSDIFREVDEALNREKAEKFWKAYGPLVLGAIGVLIASTAITSGYRAWSSHKNQEQTAKLIAAGDESNAIEAMQNAAKITTGAHAAIALMNAANKAAEAKDFATTSSLYAQVRDDKSAPKELRDLAVILKSRADLNVTSPAPDYAALIKDLTPVAQSDKSPYANLAKLEMATLYGSGLKDFDNALKTLEPLTKDGIDESLREKAKALKEVYSFDQSQPKKQ